MRLLEPYTLTVEYARKKRLWLVCETLPVVAAPYRHPNYGEDWVAVRAYIAALDFFIKAHPARIMQAEDIGL